MQQNKLSLIRRPFRSTIHSLFMPYLPRINLAQKLAKQLLTVAVLAASSLNAYADICTRLQKDGTLLITNKCPGKNQKKIIVSRPTSDHYPNIYKYTDNNGVVSYADTTPANTPFQLVSLGRAKPKNYYSFLTTYKPRKQKFSSLISQAALEHQIDERLVHAVIQSESAYNANAVSSAGAVGLMQLMEATAARYGVYNRTDPEQNIKAGTSYLRDLLDMFNGNVELAVAAYNAGEGAVKKYNNQIPPYRETQNYVRQVLSLYNRALRSG